MRKKGDYQKERNTTTLKFNGNVLSKSTSEFNITIHGNNNVKNYDECTKLFSFDDTGYVPTVNYDEILIEERNRLRKVKEIMNRISQNSKSKPEIPKVAIHTKLW